MPPFEDAHTIRLRGPWEFVAGEASGRVNLPPSDEFLSDLSTATDVVWRRGFGRPTELESNRVILVVAASRAEGRVSVNGIHLGDLDLATEELRFDITTNLELRNELVIETQGLCVNESEMPFGEVRLEIVDTD